MQLWAQKNAVDDVTKYFELHVNEAIQQPGGLGVPIVIFKMPTLL